jgi:tetrachlorobenzoquinone reductase
VNGLVAKDHTLSELIEVRLEGIRYAARDTYLYEWKPPDGGPLPPYEPGAHIDLHLPNGLSRSYSLVFADLAPTSYTVAIKRDPAGRGGSRYITDEMYVGDTVRISAPRNNFRLREDSPHTELLAGGIGITPIWCMVQRLNALGRTWRLHYACRSRADMAFLDELRDFPGALLHFDEESGGRPLDVAGAVAAAPAGAHLYCCGPVPMLTAFENATKDWPVGQIHVEYFVAKDLPPARTGGFTVALARTGVEYYVPEGETILGVLLDHGIVMDYSCESGICGACETRVMSGIPDHRDSILNKEEQAENKRVMICCSGSKSERLVLDL